MLRRSTGWSEETKRVGVVRDRAMGVGRLNWRCVAVARLRSGDTVLGSAVVLGRMGASDAIACRRRRSPSCCAPSVDAIFEYGLDGSCEQLVDRRLLNLLEGSQYGLLGGELYGSLD